MNLGLAGCIVVVFLRQGIEGCLPLSRFPLDAMPDSQAVTQMLVSLEAGNREVIDDLFSMVYDELHRIAHRQLSWRSPGQTLNTTALVHEAYLKLVDAQQVRWKGRTHFFALSARAMRQILINYARSAKAQKRGGDWQRLTWDELMAGRLDRADVLLALDEGLSLLATVDERMSRVVELRFFGGLKEAEIAQVLGVSTRTVRRDWRSARAWLSRFLLEDPDLDSDLTDIP